MTTDISALQRQYAYLRQKQKCNRHIILSVMDSKRKEDMSNQNKSALNIPQNHLETSRQAKPRLSRVTSEVDPITIATVTMETGQSYGEFLDSITPQVIGNTKCILVQHDKLAQGRKKARKRTKSASSSTSSHCSQTSNPETAHHSSTPDIGRRPSSHCLNQDLGHRGSNTDLGRRDYKPDVDNGCTKSGKSCRSQSNNSCRNQDNAGNSVEDMERNMSNLIAEIDSINGVNQATKLSGDFGKHKQKENEEGCETDHSNGNVQSDNETALSTEAPIENDDVDNDNVDDKNNNNQEKKDNRKEGYSGGMSTCETDSSVTKQGSDVGQMCDKERSASNGATMCEVNIKCCLETNDSANESKRDIGSGNAKDAENENSVEVDSVQTRRGRNIDVNRALDHDCDINMNCKGSKESKNSEKQISTSSDIENTQYLTRYGNNGDDVFPFASFNAQTKTINGKRTLKSTKSLTLDSNVRKTHMLPLGASDGKANIYNHFCRQKRHLSVDSAYTSVDNQNLLKITNPFPIQHLNQNRIKAGMKLGLYKQK